MGFRILFKTLSFFVGTHSNHFTEYEVQLGVINNLLNFAYHTMKFNYFQHTKWKHTFNTVYNWTSKIIGGVNFVLGSCGRVFFIFAPVI